ncbi:hypothetical protein GOP47_0013513 [Adiantum capillus-veneris]|uniref:Uncharacterized protein n=1 Tax=Adiantum capillus-veneris TaxID=13818 RepID=A0A9D4UPL8_ADICA|nr:hypothetical protein GOP47_0013513 [Adiantum capillus-veneris]
MALLNASTTFSASRHHFCSSVLASQGCRFSYTWEQAADLQPGLKLELKYAKPPAKDFVEFMETMPKQEVVAFFRDIAAELEGFRQLQDFHMKVRDGDGDFRVEVFFNEERNGPDVAPYDDCIGCCPDTNLFVGQEPGMASKECILEEFSLRPYAVCRLDAKGRTGCSIMPGRHVERMSELDDDELYGMWRVATRMLRQLGIPFIILILNHGRYRTLYHLNLKLWVEEMGLADMEIFVAIRMESIEIEVYDRLWTPTEFCTGWLGCAAPHNLDGRAMVAEHDLRLHPNVELAKKRITKQSALETQELALETTIPNEGAVVLVSRKRPMTQGEGESSERTPKKAKITKDYLAEIRAKNKQTTGTTIQSTIHEGSGQGFQLASSSEKIKGATATTAMEVPRSPQPKNMERALKQLDEATKRIEGYKQELNDLRDDKKQLIDLKEHIAEAERRIERDEQRTRELKVEVDQLKKQNQELRADKEKLTRELEIQNIQLEHQMVKSWRLKQRLEHRREGNPAYLKEIKSQGIRPVSMIKRALHHQTQEDNHQGDNRIRKDCHTLHYKRCTCRYANL